MRHGKIETCFDKALFSTGPVINWLSKSKGKPVVKIDMTANEANSTLEEENTDLRPAIVQPAYHQTQQMTFYNTGYNEGLPERNQYSQTPLQYSQLSQISQFSRHHE